MYFHFQICLEQDLPDSKPSSCPPPQLHRFHPPVFSLLAARLAHHCFPQRGLVCFNRQNPLKKTTSTGQHCYERCTQLYPAPLPICLSRCENGYRWWNQGVISRWCLWTTPQTCPTWRSRWTRTSRGGRERCSWWDRVRWSDWLNEKFWRDCQVQGWDSIDIDIRILKSIDINKILYLAYWTPLLPGSRVGLARARLLGVEKAAAPILLFLDSHCEVVSRPLDNLLTVRSARWE